MARRKKVDKVTLVEKLANELLALMQTKAKASAKEDKENEAIEVNIEAEEERGLLIGHHGDTINAVQAVLGMMVRKEVGEWIRIIVNIGDWREKQEEHLKKLAREVAERVKQTGEPQPLYNLTAAQRRIVHLELSGEADIATESIGEGPERYLVVKPK
jgi:spoIIIJ-associated protein